MKKDISPLTSFRRFGAALLVALTLIPAVKAVADSPKRELRAAWYATVWAIDYPRSVAGSSTTSYGATASGVTKMKAEADAYLDRAKAAGHNAIFFQVRPMADRMYMTTSYTTPAGKTYTVYEPVSVYLSGKRGSNPYGNFDALQYWIEGAHARGMELHAWVNPYRMNSSLSTSYDTNVASWIIEWNAGTAAQPNNKKIFNPALEQTNVRIENVCCVLAGAYDIDGILFDDYFYPENLCKYTGSDAPDYAQYEAYIKNGGTLKVEDWRRDNVNKMVKRVYNAIKSVKPHIRFGISPAGVAFRGLKDSDGIPALSTYAPKADDWQYRSIGSDPMAWLRDKTVDFISPQIYWKMNSSTNPFGPISKWYGIVAQKFERPIFASHYLTYDSWGNTKAEWEEIATQIEANRSANLDGSPGSVMYSAKNALNGCDELVASRCFTSPALVPAMTWFAASDPGKVGELAKNGTKLTWNAVSGMRYVVYAVPKDVKEADAVNGTNGIKSIYMLGMSYNPAYTLTAAQAKDGDYWYAVSVLDRFGNEWAYTTLGLTPPVSGYESKTENAFYDGVKEDNTELTLENIWIRRPDTNPLTVEVELARDMTARSGDDQPVRDMVYVISRSEAATTASTILSRFNGVTGEELDPLQVTYDAAFSPGYYPANGILTDDANQLLTHTLTLPNGNLSIAVIDPATGKAKTMFSKTIDFRVDHLDVYGTVAEGKTWYVIAPNKDKVVRYTMNGSTITETVEIAISLGNGARAHAINENLAWVNGSGAKPGLVNFSTKKVVTTASAGITPSDIHSTAMATFNYEGDAYMFYQMTAPADGGKKAVTWSVASSSSFSTAAGVNEAKHLWQFPVDGAGSKYMVSGDFGAAVSILLSPTVPQNAAGTETVVASNPVHLYGYSCGNGIAAYKLVKMTTTGVEDIAADADDGAPVYYDLNGYIVNPETAAPGIYIRKQNGKVQKVVLP